jgi:hypothetical protein
LIAAHGTARWTAGSSVFLFVKLGFEVVPRDEVERSICQLGVDPIELIQVSHRFRVTVAMMVNFIRTRNHHGHAFVDLIKRERFGSLR